MPDVIINPLSFVPLGPFDPLVNYWHITLSRVMYRTEFQDVLALAALAGAGPDDVTDFPELPIGEGEGLFGQGPDNISRTVIIRTPNGDVMHVRGTTTHSQLLQELVRSHLVEIEPWPGKVNSYFGVRANQIWERVKDALTDRDFVPWIATGHSLGGGIASLIHWRGAAKCWTLGQPRDGDSFYALAHDDRQKMRVFNLEDITPRIPVRDVVTDVPGRVYQYYTGVPRLGLGYAHWGIAWRFEPDGFEFAPPDTYTATDVPELLARTEAGGDVIVRNHLPPVSAFRVRRMIPVDFPAPLGEPTGFGGLAELDAMNFELNPIEGWEQWDLPEFESGIGGGSNIGDWDEIQDYAERDVNPFRCPNPGV